MPIALFDIHFAGSKTVVSDRAPCRFVCLRQGHDSLVCFVVMSEPQKSNCVISIVYFVYQNEVSNMHPAMAFQYVAQRLTAFRIFKDTYDSSFYSIKKSLILLDDGFGIFLKSR